MRLGMWRLALLVGLVALIWLPSPALGAQSSVRAVFFYLTTCDHCHAVLEETLPPIMERFGDQLEIAFVDIDTMAGNDLFYATIDTFAVPVEVQGVPMMIVGTQLLNGDLEIDEQLEAVIEAGLASGGVDWPELPGIDAIVAEMTTLQDGRTPTETAAEPSAPTETTLDAIGVSAMSTPAIDLAHAIPDTTAPSLREVWAADPIAFGIALVVFALMAGSVLWVGLGWWRNGITARSAQGWQRWAIPVLCVFGIGVAAYLSYVETTSAKAVCGPVGACNAVQQSEYARLFDVLPIGVLGLLGYLFIIALWAWPRYGPAAAVRRTRWVLPGLLLFGVVFSAYLTFVELFFIRAICMWCVTSAITMTLLLWAVYRGWTETAPRRSTAPPSTE